MANIKLIDETGTERTYSGVTKIVTKDADVTDGYVSFGSNALNIACQSTAPDDTTKLWVKTYAEVGKISMDNIFSGANTYGIETKSATFPMYIAYSGTSCGVVGTKCYIFGGYYYSSTYPTGNQYNRTVYCYDAGNNTTSLIGYKFPAALALTSCGVVGTKCYIFGGRSSDSDYLNTIYCYDTETSSVSTMGATLPEALVGTSCGVVGTKCYIFGGSKSGVLKNAIYCYDTISDSISTVSVNLPVTLSESMCGVVGTKCYIFGGYNGSSKNIVYCYDTENNTVTTLTQHIPTNLSSAGCCVVGTKCYLLGGRYVPSTGNSELKNTIYCFDAERNTFSTLTQTLPQNAAVTAYGVVGTKCYLFPSGTTNIIEFTAQFPLDENDILIVNGYTGKPVKLINTPEADIEIGVHFVFIGDENDLSENAEAYVHNGTDWVRV